MKPATVKDKHFKLDEAKIKKAKEILKARTETETIEKALEFVLATDLGIVKKNEVHMRILARRNKLSTVKGVVADWVREGREERNKMYGG